MRNYGSTLRSEKSLQVWEGFCNMAPIDEWSGKNGELKDE